MACGWAFRLDGAASVRGTVDGAAVTYPDARPGADVVLSATDSGIKEDLVPHGRKTL
ncbi:hypothetical protein GCM10010170_086320 [Dactylosporangium salmoneum]|uniref:Uncharacterized protein n=1 Tax=Dactylosporangium salmoneum TaxID=53361 RepID=A0ABN3HGI4_9ACTN